MDIWIRRARGVDLIFPSRYRCWETPSQTNRADRAPCGKKTLEEAKQSVAAAGLDPITSITKRLGAAKNSLSSASDDIAEFATNADVTDLVDDIASILESIRSTIEEVQAEILEADDGS